MATLDLPEKPVVSLRRASLVSAALTWGVEIALVAAAVGAAWGVRVKAGGDAFSSVLVFGGVLVGLTLFLLALLRRIVPFRSGTFDSTSRDYLLWKLHSFLCATNLFFFYQNALLPPPLRKFFARLLGAHMGQGLISIGGILADPFFITVGETAMVGHDALLMPSDCTSERLVLKPIQIGRGAVVGARSLVMPGVVIGENAMVKAMSWVPEDTHIPPNEVWGGVPAIKLGEAPAVSANVKFSSWRDNVLTPLATGTIVALAGLSTWALARAGGVPEPFVGFVAFYGFFVLWTLLSMGLLRAVFPIREGVYSFKDQAGACYAWTLHYFFCMFNLFVHYQNGLLPPVLRKLFYRILGARFGQSLLSMPGVLTDPFLVKMGPRAVVDHDALILPHAVTFDSLVLKRVTVGEGAYIGPRAVLMPGVVVGANAEIQALSLVPMDRQVGEDEMWGGVPARKIGDRPPPRGGEPLIQWPDFLLTPLVVLSLLGAAGVCAAQAKAIGRLSLFSTAVVFYVGWVAMTLAVLAAIRWAWPFQEGTISAKENPWAFYRWKLHGFLCATNLFLHYQNGVMPFPVRRMFNRFMGARLGKIPSPLGLLGDPFFVTVDDRAVIGFDSLLLPLELTGSSLTLGRIRIGRGAVVGTRAILLRGVTVGEGARVDPFSLVLPGTQIPPHEIWGGIPAVKRGHRAPASL